jgi:signal transduction histidine kinase
MVVVSTLLGLLVYPLAWFFGSPFAELASLPSLGVYAFAAWRLAPGTGPLAQRVGRALLWGGLFALIGGLVSWFVVRLVPYPDGLFGIDGSNAHVSFLSYAANSLLITLGLYTPARLLISLWLAGRARLRWQLTFSYLLIGVLSTLVLPVAFSVVIGISSLSVVPVLVDPQTTAQRALPLLAPLIRPDASPTQLGSVLQTLVDNRASLPVPSNTSVDPTTPLSPFGAVRRMTLLRPDGTVLASAGVDAPRPDQPLPAEDLARLALLRAQENTEDCIVGRPSDGLFVDTAVCKLVDSRGSFTAELIVENNIDRSLQYGAIVGRIMSITLVGTIITLLSSLIVVVVVLLLALAVGSLLAHRLTRRIERLAVATGDVAGGNFARRVEVGTADEIGRLSADFNVMARRLEEREQALQVEKARVERLLAANRELVANVSHELRTPLATIRGYLEALALDHGDHLPAHDLDVLQREAQRLTALIDDLFTLARAEVQQLPMTMTAVDAAALVRHVGEMVAPLARREREIEIVVALPSTLPPVQADRARLEQVLLNLVQNALRHTPPGGIVALEGIVEKEFVTLAVADTGVGISADELPRVFDRFYRGDSSRTRETGGAGLGLTLVRELITSMGGSVTVESSPGRGTRFHVRLRKAVFTEAAVMEDSEAGAIAAR